MATFTDTAYGTVTCRVLVNTPDLEDSDTLPEQIAPSGYVYLEPRRAAIPTTADGTATVLVQDLTPMVLDGDGYGCIPDENGNPTDKRSVQVPAVEGMTYRVTFGELTVPAYAWQSDTLDNTLTIKGFDIPVKPGETTEIAQYLPLGTDPATGGVFVKGDRGTGVKSARSVNNELVLTLDTGEDLPPISLPASTVPGPANKLTVGTVASGTSAAATITGTAPNQTLNLTLPKGDKGDTGDPGAGVPAGGTTGQVIARTGSGSTEWKDIPQPVLNLATSTQDGLMPKADKATLDASAESPKADALVKYDPSGRVNTNDPQDAINAVNKRYLDAQLAAVQPATQAYIDGALAGTASVDELVQSVFMTGWPNNGTLMQGIASSAQPTVWIAPFACKVVYAAFIWDFYNQPVDSTAIMTMRVGVRPKAGGTVVEFATKTSQDEAVTARKTWEMGAGTWTEANATMAAGDSMTLRWSLATGVTIKLPMTYTFRVVPL